MNEPTTPTTPAPPANIDDAMTRVRQSQASQTTQGASTATQPSTTPAPAAGSPPAKRIVKYKFDHEERDLDLDELNAQAEAWYKDPTKPQPLMDTIQRGYGFERAVERARKEAIEATRKAWNDWINSHKYDVVRDATHPSGWKLVSKESVATPTQAPVDPLAKEEADILALVNADAAGQKELARLTEIRALRAKQEAVREWEAKTNATAQEASERARYEEAKGWLYGEIDGYVKARAKSFDGPDTARRIAKLRQMAFNAGEAAAKEGKSALDAAKAVIFEEADDLDARQKAWQASLTAAPAKPDAPPVVGSAPSGGNGAQGYKNIDEAMDAILKKRWSR